MPSGKGSYGHQRGRPPKRKRTKRRKKIPLLDLKLDRESGN